MLSPLSTIYPYLLGVIWLSVFTLATWSSLRRLLPNLGRGEKLALVTVLGIAATSWLGLLTWYALGVTWGNIALFGLATGIIAIDWSWYKTVSIKRILRQTAERIDTHRLASVGLLLTLILITALVAGYALPIGPDGWYSSGPSWGDTPLHLSLSSYFYENGVKNLILPIYPTAKLAYPFLIDLHSAQLYQATTSWQASLALPTWALLTSLTFLLYRVGWRLSRSRIASFGWVTLIAASGSAAGALAFLSDISAGLPEVLRDYANLGASDPSTQQYFANLTTSHLLPQRSYLIGVSIAMSIILLLVATYNAKLRPIRLRSEARTAYLVAVIVGLLPWVHIHSFIVVGLFLTLFTATLVIRSRRIPWLWIRAGGLALVLAAPQLVWQFSAGYSSGFSYWNIGWLTTPGKSPVEFWWINLGLLVPFICLAAGRLFFRARAEETWSRLLVTTGLILFVACNVYIFQPNQWDNMKFLTYSYIFLTLPVATWGAQLWRVRPALRPILLATLIVIITPGVLSITRQITVSDKLLSNQDLAVAGFVRTNTPPDGVILIAPRHNHPVPVLTGRPVVMGYPGWLGSYGIDYLQTERDSSEIWTGGSSSTDLLIKHRVDFVVLSDAEAVEAGTTSEQLAERFDSIYSQDGWHVYRVRQ